MEDIQGGHCSWSKMQGGQSTTLTLPCRKPDLLRDNPALTFPQITELCKYCMYLAIDNGGMMRMNSLCAVSAAWSKTSRAVELVSE